MQSTGNKKLQRLELPSTLSRIPRAFPSQLPASRLGTFMGPPQRSSTAIKSRFGSMGQTNYTGIGKVTRPRMGAMSTTARVRPYPDLSVLQRENLQVNPITARLNFETCENESSTIYDSFSSLSGTSPASKTSSPKPSLISPKPNSKLMSAQTSPNFSWKEAMETAELIKTKTELKKMESMLQVKTEQQEHKRVEWEQEMDKLRKELKHSKEQNGELDRQLKHYQQKEEEAKTQLDIARDEFGTEREKLEKKCLSIQKEVDSLSNQLTESKFSMESLSRKHENDLMVIQHQIEMLEAEKLKLTQERDVFAKHVEEIFAQAKDAEALDAELVKCRNEIIRLQEELKSKEEGAKLTQVVCDELQMLKECKNENEQLKRELEIMQNTQNSKLFSEDEMNIIKMQLQSCQEQLKQTQSFESECESLKQKLLEWEQVLAAKFPLQVSQQISSLQQSENDLKSEINNVKAKLEENETVIRQQQQQQQHQQQQLEQKKIESEKEISQLKKKVAELGDLAKKLNKKFILVTHERDGYKNTLAKYEQDVTIDFNKASQERISFLEATLEQYRTNTSQLEADLEKFKQQPIAKIYEEEIKKLKEEIIKTSETVTKQTEAEKSKIIQIQTSNQAELSRLNEELKQVGEENQRLQERIKALESEKMNNNSAKSEEDEETQKEIEKLKKDLASGKKKQELMMKYFKKTSNDFRDVCHRLTGYRIDVLKNNQYKLTNVYANSSEECLLFELSTENEKELKLLENDYSKNLDENVQIYLVQHDSFPAFLSSLTLDLFQRQTNFVSP